ncbi:hypothetical protein HCH_03381 [Hahella chejuensis KCTC 2396]|uniref:DUF4185 domain-containing protein n=1 Tax=Hahella chejuensis (strain KCTC 2396) TaxID=349521 RepID=Q2SGU3_HAHCH|nr:DUF4185 domain-containing protein [Hahella chejuensis]ABC30131.1 hypothetical protein HCH_03381 [Hahella chejuensis KCTC 2396]
MKCIDHYKPTVLAALIATISAAALTGTAAATDSQLHDSAASAEVVLEFVDNAVAFQNGVHLTDEDGASVWVVEPGDSGGLALKKPAQTLNIRIASDSFGSVKVFDANGGLLQEIPVGSGATTASYDARGGSPVNHIELENQGTGVITVDDINIGGTVSQQPEPIVEVPVTQSRSAPSMSIKAACPAYSGTHSSYSQAFDTSQKTFANIKRGGHLQVDFCKKVSVSELTVNYGRAEKERGWLTGSNDGKNWDKVAVLNPNDNVSVRTYKIGAKTGYRYYRIISNGSSSHRDFTPYYDVKFKTGDSGGSDPSDNNGAPYPLSDWGMSIDWSTYHSAAYDKNDGGDNWPTTWSGDGNVYTAWGDGGGFHGDQRKERAALGVARIAGVPGNLSQLKATDLADFKHYWTWFKDKEGNWTKPNPEGIKECKGNNLPGCDKAHKYGYKSYGIIAIGKSLYMIVNNHAEGMYTPGYTYPSDLYKSVDNGKSWKKTGVRLENDLLTPTFIQMAKGHGSYPYVYIYSSHKTDKTHGLNSQIPGEIYLIRVSTSKIEDPGAYEYYAGGNGGAAKWSKNWKDRAPAFQDKKGGVGWNCSSFYHVGLDRFFLFTQHGENASGNIGLFEAETPWGPWKTVHYANQFTNGKVEDTSFLWNIPLKWLDVKKHTFTMTYTGIKQTDRWNTVNGQFYLRKK